MAEPEPVPQPAPAVRRRHRVHIEGVELERVEPAEEAAVPAEPVWMT